MLYPQQNLVRNKLDLSGIWDFRTNPDGTGEQAGWANGLQGARPRWLRTFCGSSG